MLDLKTLGIAYIRCYVRYVICPNLLLFISSPNSLLFICQLELGREM